MSMLNVPLAPEGMEQSSLWSIDKRKYIEDLSLALMPLCVSVCLLVPVSVWMKPNTIAGVMLAYDQQVGEEIEMSLF